MLFIHPDLRLAEINHELAERRAKARRTELERRHVVGGRLKVSYLRFIPKREPCSSPLTR
jgi:hypothetical protein